MKIGFIFDLDGTLSESYVSLAASLKYVYARLQAARVAMETHPGETICSALLSEGPLWPISEEGRIIDPILGKYKEQMDQAANEIPELSKVFYKLHAQTKKLAVTSSKPVKLTERLVRNLGIRDYLIGIYGPKHGGEDKPNPSMIKRAMEDMNLPKEEIIFVGDLPIDADMARAAGIQVALIAKAAARAQYVYQTPDHLFDEWQEVLTIV